MGIGEHQQKSDDKAELEGCLTPLTNRDPEKAADIPKQGIWQKLRSHTVPLLYVIVGAAISVIVIIILAAHLSVRTSTGSDKYTAYPEKLPGEKHETKVEDFRCTDDWILFEGKCLFFSSQLEPWTDSLNFCKARNSSLAIFDNVKETNFFIETRFKSNYWIGLSRAQNDSGWIGTDEKYYSETRFTIHRNQPYQGEPENVYLNGDGFKSENGNYPKKCICSKRFSSYPP